MKITKNRYLLGFSIVVILLALVRILFPSVAGDTSEKAVQKEEKNTVAVKEEKDSKDKKDKKKPVKVVAIAKTETKDTGVSRVEKSGEEILSTSPFPLAVPNFFDANYNEVRNKISSVPGYAKTFPDGQDLQIGAATKYGVSPVQNRRDAEQRKSELVFVGANPYYHIDKLQRSIPYLVPRAAVLLNDIGRSFYDSLQIKGVPLHQIIVTSVMRSRDDVKKLSNYNSNATENSCHLYGTTFDICYNRYKTVSDPCAEPRRAVRNDTLKWVLSEVLRDMREAGRCYVKYEVKQGCFHITVR
ncbi:MAG: DUF5715 family protein [Prevotella sp.]|nr:DUF5715 family protein [Prevotella sp.]